MLALKWWQSCFGLRRAGITDVCHHASKLLVWGREDLSLCLVVCFCTAKSFTVLTAPFHSLIYFKLMLCVVWVGIGGLALSLQVWIFSHCCLSSRLLWHFEWYWHLCWREIHYKCGSVVLFSQWWHPVQSIESMELWSQGMPASSFALLQLAFGCTEPLRLCVEFTVSVLWPWL